MIDYKAKQSGFLKVAILPCDYDGNDQVELCVEDPMDLVRRHLAVLSQFYDGNKSCFT